MSVGAILVASFLLTLARPATWLLALATFLLRGGVLLVVAPIVVLPSAVGLGNVLAPLLTTLLFRGVTPSIAFMATAVVAGLLLWLFGGGLVAAAAEAELTRRVAADEETWPPSSPRPGFVAVAHPAWRVLTVRLIAHLPLLLALSWGAIRIVTTAYRELTVPSDVGVPLVLRVAAGAPDALAVLLTAWLLGEVVGAVAARRVILLGDRVPTALGAAIVRLVPHALRTATFFLVPLVPLALVLVVVAFAGSATWEALRAALSIGSDRLVVIALVLALVALFAGGLLLIGVASAWRASIWTVELAGTYGAMGYGPVAHWNRSAESGTLSDLRPRGVDPDTR